MASQWWPGERNVAPATAATTTGTDKLTIVLAARTHDENGFPRVPLLARSLTKFLAYEAVLEMLVVCPDPDVGTFQRLDALRAMRWPLRVVPDSALLSLSEHNFERVTPAEEWAVGGGRGANYRMQMLTKISVASLVRSDFYLVLDWTSWQRAAHNLPTWCEAERPCTQQSHLSTSGTVAPGGQLQTASCRRVAA